MKPYDIDPFFAQILPENSTAVRAKLKAQIAADGKCRDAFVVGIIDDQKESHLSWME